MCGANDAGVETASTAYNSGILSFVSQAKASGYQVIVLTMTDAGEPRETFHNQLNPLITGGAAANGYIVADMTSDPFVSCNGCFTNGTYFQSDGVHLTPTGLAVVATYLETALATAGLQ